MNNLQEEVRDLIWLFGRGASMDCGLSWSVPEEWSCFPREDQIQRIKDVLEKEMHSCSVSVDPYRQLIQLLSKNTSPTWRHRFFTTNWDTLLNQTLHEQYPYECPTAWLRNTYVSHLNGSVSPKNRSDFHTNFLLESDPRGFRKEKPESNIIYNHMLICSCFVVLGMSFECQTDSSLLRALQSQDMPARYGLWIIVNPCQETLNTACNTFKSFLPNAETIVVQKSMSDWIAEGLPELVNQGILVSSTSQSQ